MGDREILKCHSSNSNYNIKVCPIIESDFARTTKNTIQERTQPAF